MTSGNSPERQKNSQYDILARARSEMLAAGFTPDFEPQVLAEIDHLSEQNLLKSAKAEPSTRDLRHLLWSSIDNLESQDLDQIEYAERGPAETIHLIIGIADVASFVAKGSAIDSHAASNSTSVYTGVETFPMLPERLSYHLTSLLPEEDRLAMCVELTIEKTGKVVTSDVFQALVRNQAKLDYGTVGRWLAQGKDAAVPEKIEAVENLKTQLLLQDEVRDHIHAMREQMGSLSLHTPEAQTIARDGEVLDLQLVESNAARDLIENCMVAANIATAKFLQAKGVPSLRRIVKTPERWPRIVDVARSYGQSLPADPDARALAKFLLQQKINNPENFSEVSLSIVKLLGRGEYTVRVPGESESKHFALAVNDYTHSTAPNRRYPDMITQRLLQAVLRGQASPYTVEELTIIAQKCTHLESEAKKVERKMRKIAAAVFMAKRIGDQFDGIVTGVKTEPGAEAKSEANANANAIYVRTIKPPVEGRIVGGAELKNLDVGDRIKVRLISTDPENAFIDFKLA